MIDVPTVVRSTTAQISEKSLADVVSARYEELFTLVSNMN